jgi:WD40 repeat protein
VLPGLDILISGGSDKDVRLWDLRATQSWDFAKEAAANPVVNEDTNSTKQGQDPAPKPSQLPVFPPLPFLASLRAHTRPIECLGFHRTTLPPSKREDENEELSFTGRLVVWSADTMGTVTMWEVWREASGEVRSKQGASWRGHETGIYDLVVGDAEVWTGKSTTSPPLLHLFVLPSAYWMEVRICSVG